MTNINISNAVFEKWILGSIKPNSQISCHISTKGWYLYAEKTNKYTLAPNSKDSSKNWYKYQDSNSTFDHTPKTGYHIVDLRNGGALNVYYVPDNGVYDQIFNSAIDYRLNPHDVSQTTTVLQGTHSFSYAIVPDETDDTLLLSNLLDGVSSPQYPPPSGGRTRVQPTYLESLYKSDKFYEAIRRL